MAKHYSMKAESGSMNMKPTGDIVLPAQKQVKIMREGDNVVIELEGKFLRFNYTVADQVAKFMLRHCATITQEKRIIQDLK